VRELLAYLALPAREKDTSWDQVADHAYKAYTSKDDADKLQEMLHNDVKSLRKAVQDKCAEAGVDYINPIEVTGHGKGACYRLAEAYQVVDLARYEDLIERVEHLQQVPLLPEDHRAFRKDYEEILAMIKKGFLGPHQPDRHVSNWWVTPYKHRYRMRYHRLLLDLAAYEFGLSATQEEEEDRRASIQAAASLYAQSAVLTAPVDEEEIERGEQTRLSEHALRQGLICYGKLADLISVHQTYQHYLKTMKKRFSGYRPEPLTREVYEQITESDGTAP
jgi:hypothetical protein